MPTLSSLVRAATRTVFPLLVACNSESPPSSSGSDTETKTACTKPTGPGVEHTAPISTDETWRAKDSPHRVPSSLRVDATLTLEPCVVVEVGGGAVITVGNGGATLPSGAIVAQGTGTSGTDSSRGITLQSESDSEFWGGLLVLQTGSLDFKNVALVRAGDAQSSSAAVDARGNQDKPLSESLRFRDVAIVDAGTQGVKVSGYAAFTADSTGLTISGSGAQPEADARIPTGYPLDLEPPAVHTIPDGGAYDGNRRDEIMVRGATRVAVDEAFPDRGLPYFVDETLLMYDADGSALTLTIEPGVTLRFDASDSGGVGLVLGDAASHSAVKLVAKGTSKKPILLTSASEAPEAGAWAGVLMADAPADGNAIENTTFEYAGGFTGSRGFGCGPLTNVGGLIVQSWRPASAFVKKSTFRSTIGAGIVSGWTNAEGEDGPDLREDNVFEDIVDIAGEASCEVTEWATDPNATCRNDTRPTCVGE